MMERRTVLLALVTLATSAQQDIFSNVPLLQKALVPILPAASWRNQGGHFYGSSQISLPGGSVVSYAFIGKTATKVDGLNISTMVNSPADVAAANRKLVDATWQWFKSVGRSAPAGLLTAIRQSKDFNSSANSLKVECVQQGLDVIVRIQPQGK